MKLIFERDTVGRGDWFCLGYVPSPAFRGFEWWYVRDLRAWFLKWVFK